MKEIINIGKYRMEEIIKYRKSKNTGNDKIH